MPDLPGFLYAEPILALNSGMRVSDKVLKSVVFIGKMKAGKFTPTATGFIVGKRYEEGLFLHIVTCAHAVTGQSGLHFRYNTRDGGTKIVPINPEDWHYHPDATRFIDVAVVPVMFDQGEADLMPIPLNHFCTADLVDARDIGVGDELFYPSLFFYHHGTARNLPVMRGATLAAMPSEKVQTASGPIEAYLIEGRSMSGHSGSPVFVNLLAARSYYADRKIEIPHPSEAQRYLVLGLIRGFVKASDVGEYITDAPPRQEDLWVNSGISTVIPAWQIIETINQDDLEAGRIAAIERDRANSAETPAFIREKGAATEEASDNPSHKEDFKRLLDAAAKANKPAS